MNKFNAPSNILKDISNIRLNGVEEIQDHCKTELGPGLECVTKSLREIMN
jgi:hypothetical protein